MLRLLLVVLVTLAAVWSPIAAQIIDHDEVPNIGPIEVPPLGPTSPSGRLDIGLDLPFLNGLPFVKKNFPTLTGKFNNLRRPARGKAITPLQREFDAYYESDGNTPVPRPARVSPRNVSNALLGGNDTLSNYTTTLFIYWGQFLDHDMDFVPATGVRSRSRRTITTEPLPGQEVETMPIPVPEGCPDFDPDGLGDVTLPFTRSLYKNTKLTGVRQQINAISAYLDSSQVYGSSKAVNKQLRTKINGTMKVTEPDVRDGSLFNGPLLPIDEESGFAFAGDVRALENPVLTSLQVVMVREHNRLLTDDAVTREFLRAMCGDIVKAAKRDKCFFFNTRVLVAAIQNHITYQEWLPILLGSQNAPPSAYPGYDRGVNAQVSNVFATAAFRLHPIVPAIVPLANVTNSTTFDTIAIPVERAVSMPNFTYVTECSVERLWICGAVTPSNIYDLHITNGLRNKLRIPDELERSTTIKTDLASLNIQRARDHGVLITDQSQPRCSDSTSALYRDTPWDAWVLMIGEKNSQNCPETAADRRVEETGVLGPTATTIIADQFSRSRAGDRFFYENLDEEIWGEIFDYILEDGSLTLGQLLRRNTKSDLQQLIPDNVFTLE